VIAEDISNAFAHGMRVLAHGCTEHAGCALCYLGSGARACSSHRTASNYYSIRLYNAGILGELVVLAAIRGRPGVVSDNSLHKIPLASIRIGDHINYLA
jgi:hypothetical protein